MSRGRKRTQAEKAATERTSTERITYQAFPKQKKRGRKGKSLSPTTKREERFPADS